MDLLLIRHLESTKNVRNAISSTDDRESLTHRGCLEGRRLAAAIAFFQEKNGLRLRYVHCAHSARAIQTADLIATRTGAVTKPYEDLRSTRSGILAGLSEADAARISPGFIWQLQLYRAGLLSSYELERAEGKEPISDFERRVRRRLLRIIKGQGETLKIIITHRSPLTAMLLYFARTYYRYPRSFYGHVPLDLGHVSWLRRDSCGAWEFKSVNCPPGQILRGGNLAAASTALG